MKKTNYEIILGVVTLIISLSAFKTELSKINIDLGLMNLNLAEYFLFSICGFSFSLYLYVFEITLKDTRFGKYKVFLYTERIAFVLFAFIVLLPLGILMYFILYKMILFLSIHKELAEVLSKISSTLTGLVTLFYSYLSVKIYRQKKDEELQIQNEEEEIVFLEKANLLFNDKYFSQSILESYKTLEFHLYKIILKKNIRVSRYRMNDIISIVRRENLISENNLIEIEKLRKMRNASAHTDFSHTEKQAKEALNFVKQLINKNGNS